MKQDMQNSIVKNRMHSNAKTKTEAFETKIDKQSNRQRWEEQKRLEE